MDIKQIKLQFSQYLPYGFASKIEKRLKAKGICFTRQYITSVCNPEKLQFEASIISEAIEVANERKMQMEDLTIKAQSLNPKPQEA